LARIHLLSGNPSEALHCCQKATFLQPGLTEAVHIAGLSYKTAGNLAAAIHAFSHIVEADQENFPARVQLVVLQSVNLG
jgi:lipoprotein NlpI